MRQQKHLGITLGMILAVALAAAPVYGATKADYDKAYRAAAQAVKKTQSVGGLWRDTQKLLEQSEKAAKAGTYDQALTLAKQAEQEAQLAYEQITSPKSVLSEDELLKT